MEDSQQQQEVYNKLKYIKLGINEVIYFDYDGEPLPLRPITSLEMDESFFNALSNTTTKIAKFVVELKLSIIKPQEVIELSNEGYAALQKYHNNLDYWFVYHGMKDFRDEEFRQPDFTKDNEFPKGYYLIRKMNHIHKIASLILTHSNAPKEVIKEIIKTKGGKRLGTLVFYLNTPLTDQAWKLTDLQKDFLYYTKLGMNRGAKEDIVSVSGETVKLGDFLKGLV